MSVRFFYVDESYDQSYFCLSAIAIRHSEWQECFSLVKNYRLRLRSDFGIPLHKELHAHELVGGRGRLGNDVVGKWQRSRIYFGVLKLIARLPKVLLFNVCLKKPGLKDPQMTAWDRLINRIERTMLAFEERELPLRQKLVDAARTRLSVGEVEQLELRLNSYSARAFIIADEGKEIQITAALRRMHVHNPIPSQFGRWSPGQVTKNIVTERIIEDPFFKVSGRSYLIQLADFVAFGLLKREAMPTPTVTRYGIDKMFDQALAGVCYKQASPRDPLGIVR
jgi:hypothetical protein